MSQLSPVCPLILQKEGSLQPFKKIIKQIGRFKNWFLTLSKLLGRLWQYGLCSFQTGGTKLERFLPKNQHAQRKLLNFENWVNGEGPNGEASIVGHHFSKLSDLKIYIIKKCH
jgi:hypothetical protein